MSTFLPRTLKKSFEWTSECQQEDLKAYLSFPLLLRPSKLEEELSLYLAISLASINTTLVRKEDKVQKPMYYTNWALHGAKEVPTDGKAQLCFGYSNPEAQTVLPGPHSGHLDCQSPTTSNEQS